MVKRGDMMNVDDVTEILAVNLIGAVPDDEQIVISTNRGEPLVGSDSLAGKAYMNICHRIMGEEEMCIRDSGIPRPPLSPRMGSRSIPCTVPKAPLSGPDHPEIGAHSPLSADL